MTKQKTFSAIITIIILMIFIPIYSASAAGIKGDANGDGVFSIRDAAFIAGALSKGQQLGSSADYNGDGKVNTRDASAIAANFAMPYSSEVKEMLELVNEARAKAGAAPLKLDSALVNAANVRAEEISEVFSHTRPDGSSFSTVLDDFSINYYCSGENIAAGVDSAEITVNQWIDSPSHYQNMINPDYTEMGIGYYYDENSTYKYHWVQIFKCN